MVTFLIETARVVLEPLEAAHADAMFEGLRDARLYEFIDDEPPESVDSLRTQYARLAGWSGSDSSYPICTDRRSKNTNIH